MVFSHPLNAYFRFLLLNLLFQIPQKMFRVLFIHKLTGLNQNKIDLIFEIQTRSVHTNKQKRKSD